MKKIIYISLIIGSVIGSFILSFFDIAMFSISGILLNSLFAFASIFIGYKIGEYFNL